MLLRGIFLICASFSLIFPLYAGEGYVVNTLWTQYNLDARKKIIEEVLNSNELWFEYNSLSVVIDTNQKEPRGKIQWRSITLSSSILRDGEFLKLLVHELWHYVDIYTLAGYSDPSNIFYRISWQNKTTKKSGETLSNFVSGYASTNKYEDFAESFVFYIFHNRDFADRAMKNDSLRRKYLFFSQYVFTKGEFVDTDYRIGKIPNYLWDTTKVPISVQKYLYSLQESI